MPLPEMEVLRGSLGAEPALEVALAAALLAAVAAGERGQLLRVYRPPPTVAFGRRDALVPGLGGAGAAARGHGFTPVIRAPGGRAAAYDEACLVLDEILPSADSMVGISERFEDDARRHARSLAGLGLDARVGEVPGEYCPGAFTVNARGKTKLAGAAQRIVRGGVLLSTVVVVEGAPRIRAVLEDVYARLGLSWEPATVGAVVDEAPKVGVEQVQAALLAGYGERYRLVDGAIRDEELAGAAARIDRHRPD